MKDNNNIQDTNSSENYLSHNQTSVQNGTDSQPASGQTTGGGEDGNWKLAPENPEKNDASSGNSR